MKLKSEPAKPYKIIMYSEYIKYAMFDYDKCSLGDFLTQ